MFVCFFLFRAAVRAFSMACLADYCFINTLHILSFLANKRERKYFYSHIFQIIATTHIDCLFNLLVLCVCAY